MTSYAHVEADAPDLAQRAQRIFAATTNAVLGTLRRDGSVRLSGIDPFWADGDLWFGSMTDARKGADLRRDPRVSLHSVPWESRRLRPDAEDPGDGDAKLSGRAELVQDPARIAALQAWLREERGFEPPSDADLFRVDVELLAVIAVEGDQLVVDRWSRTEGRSTTART